MKQWAWGLFLCVLSTGVAAGAKMKEDCTEFYEKAGAIRYYRQYFAPSSCYVSLGPQNTSNMIYRTYLATQDGLLMVFNSFGPGGNEMTGARSYYFFPRVRLPNAELSDVKAPGVTSRAAVVSLHTANDKASAVFDAESGDLVSVGGAKVRVDPQIHPGNSGGVEIKDFEGLMLDLGFARAHDPVEEKNRVVYFQDHLGNRCGLKVSEIFKYSSGDVILPGDGEIKALLGSRCPQLKLLF